jgi:hypothetical protein
MMVSATRGGGRPACPLRERLVTVIGAPPLAVRLKVGRRPCRADDVCPKPALIDASGPYSMSKLEPLTVARDVIARRLKAYPTDARTGTTAAQVTGEMHR